MGGFLVVIVGNVNGIVKSKCSVDESFLSAQYLYMFRCLALVRGLRSIKNGLCSISVGVVQTVRTSVLSGVERTGVHSSALGKRSTPR